MTGSQKRIKITKMITLCNSGNVMHLIALKTLHLAPIILGIESVGPAKFQNKHRGENTVFL